MALETCRETVRQIYKKYENVARNGTILVNLCLHFNVGHHTFIKMNSLCAQRNSNRRQFSPNRTLNHDK